LKKTFSCRTAVVLHGTDYVDQPHFMNKDYLKYIDKLGCRSKTQAEIIQKLLSMHELPFVCYSGVPDEYLEKFKLNIDKFDNIAKWKFTYVGRLVGYKRVDIIIQALNKIDFEWELNIVGDGAERKKLENLCSDLQCTDKVKFHGKIARDQVMDLLKETHCYVMVSKGEVFGLVYLEAMAASCITIGSIGEGIDGIIIDGQNGYLCEAANLDSLVMKLKEMLCNPDLQKVATEGYKTAGEFSDSSVAMDYLRKITGYYYLGN
ncbi:MAG: glycosyltransferase, partial [Butyrivibrio sp.]|nr:glycosyltransferase [Butyrivibrio sp.]